MAEKSNEVNITKLDLQKLENDILHILEVELSAVKKTIKGDPYVRDLEKELRRETAKEIDRLGQCYDGLQKELKDLRETLGKLQVCAGRLKDSSGLKARIWQAIIALIPAIGVAIYVFLQTRSTP